MKRATGAYMNQGRRAVVRQRDGLAIAQAEDLLRQGFRASVVTGLTGLPKGNVLRLAELLGVSPPVGRKAERLQTAYLNVRRHLEVTLFAQVFLARHATAEDQLAVGADTLRLAYTHFRALLPDSVVDPHTAYLAARDVASKAANLRRCKRCACEFLASVEAISRHNRPIRGECPVCRMSEGGPASRLGSDTSHEAVSTSSGQGQEGNRPDSRKKSAPIPA